MNRVTVVKRGAALRLGVRRFSVGRSSSGTGVGCEPLHALANPFKVKPYGPFERSETVRHYEVYLREKIAAKNPEICQALNTLWQAARVGEVELECFCAPHGCHGDVIQRVVGEKLPST